MPKKAKSKPPKPTGPIVLVPDLQGPLHDLLLHAEANGMIFSGYRPQIRSALEKYRPDLNKATVAAVESILEVSDSIEMPDCVEKVKAWAGKERKKLGV